MTCCARTTIWPARLQPGAAGAPWRRGGTHIIVACSNVDLRGSYDDLIRYLTQVRAGVLMQPDLEFDGDVFSLRLRRAAMPGCHPVGYLIVRQTQRIFQAATLQPERGSLAEGIRGLRR